MCLRRPSAENKKRRNGDVGVAAKEDVFQSVSPSTELSEGGDSDSSHSIIICLLEGQQKVGEVFEQGEKVVESDKITRRQ